jgi:3-hydroxybutyryl-CoA dehydrogenase
VDRIGVIGGGLTGSGIAEVWVRAGPEVVVVERDEAAPENRRRHILASLDKARDAEELSGDDAATVPSKLHSCTRLDGLAHLAYVIEAVGEDKAVKIDVVRRLDEMVADPAAVFASITSWIPIGLDTTPAFAESLFVKWRELHLAPPPLLSRMVTAGGLSRTSGRGSYAYAK